ncbi:F-box/LRR-repeat protein [Trifolium repens]|nr:F-box/LRR-repeat protein [Trifolium repens]
MKNIFRIISSALNSYSSQQTVISYYLPDECWEFIFRFIVNNDNDDDCSSNNNHYLNSLSLVSKQFLSITNRLRFSLTVSDESTCTCRLFNRFTNLNSLNLIGNYIDLDNLLIEISRFPLKQLTSLNLYDQDTIPAIGLRAFSQNITTLTSLTCSNFNSISASDLFLIAECFPLLQEFDLKYSSDCKRRSSYVDAVEALSHALIKLRKVNLTQFRINDQSLFHLFSNCKNLEEVIMFWCDEITSLGLATALRERPTLRSLSFSSTGVKEVFPTSQHVDSLVSLKGLTCLELRCLVISDELLYSIAREGLPLTRFVLLLCTGYQGRIQKTERVGYAGIICLLSKCQRIQHLDLQYTDFLVDQHVLELSSFLVELVSIDLSYCGQLTKRALLALARNCPSLSEIKMEKIGGNIIGNSDSLVEFGVYPQLKSLYLGENSWLSDEIIKMFDSIFPNLQLLDLKSCKQISDEGICQVLKKCCKIRHLNLTDCSRVKLLGMNFIVPNLEVLDLSSTNVDDETLRLISKNCCGLLKLSLVFCHGVTKKGVKHALENCKQLREIKVMGSHLSDKNRKLFSRHGCRIYYI